MFHTPVVDIYVTGACNLGCRYCFGEFDFKAGMSRSIFLQTLNFAQHAGATAIEFCGGEPLLYTDLPWAVETTRKHGFKKLILRTNGLALPQHRSFVASNFDTVGVSLDGDVHSNDMMRPTKKLSALTAEEKFRIPLEEISALKSMNPKMQILLESVATKLNLDGLRSLAHILVNEQIPLDLWKVHQFLPNNFRGQLNSQEFLLDPASFQLLSLDLARKVNGAFQLICRKSEEIDGSCLIVNRDGDILLNAKSVGNVDKHSPTILCGLLKELGAEAAIKENKQRTYKVLLGNNSEVK